MKEPLMATLGHGRIPLPTTCQAGAQGHHSTPHTRGSACWRTAASCPSGCAPSRAGTLSRTPKVTHSSPSLVLSGTHLQAAQMEQVTSFPRQQEQPFCKAAQGQDSSKPSSCLEAAALQPAPSARCLSSASPPSKASVPTPGEMAAQPPNLTDWCCGLRTYSSHRPVLPHQPQLLLQPRDVTKPSS